MSGHNTLVLYQNEHYGYFPVGFEEFSYCQKPIHCEIRKHLPPNDDVNLNATGVGKLAIFYL